MVQFHQVLLLCVICLLSSLSNASTYSTTIPSGRRVPLALFSEHFQNSTIESAKKRLYEVTSDFLVIGHGLNLSIFDNTGEPETVSYTPNTVFLNGREIKPEPITVHIRSGPEYTVSHSSDGKILAVWGPGLSLAPIHELDHPGIFVNDLSQARMSSANAPSDFVLGPDEDEEELRYKHRGSSQALIDVHPLEDDDDDSARMLATDEQSRLMPFTDRQSGCVPGRASKLLEVAAAYSTRLCRQYSSNSRTKQAIVAAFAKANDPYRRQTCLTLRVTVFDGYCNSAGDPYFNYRNRFSGSERAQENMLVTFRSFWNLRRTNVARDIAYFLPGFVDSYPILGIAYLEAACRRNIGYGWAESLYPIVIAHELGHNLGARHSSSGLMTASLNPRQNSFRFSQSSANVINRYTSRVSCLNNGVDSFPSSSPRPRFSSPPSTSRPPTNPRTCAATFSSNQGITCSSSNLRYLYWTGYLQPRLYIGIKTGYDKFTVTVQLWSSTISTYPLQITKALLYVSTKGNINSVSELRGYAPLQRLQSRTVRHEKSYSASRLRLQAGQTRCCGQKLYVYTYIEAESYRSIIRWSGTGAYKQSWSIPCGRCRSGSLVPMSSSRRCPRCA